MKNLKTLLCCFYLLSALAGFGSSARAETPKLAPTPPMGWASWNHFFCDYDENTIRKEADALVNIGTSTAAA
ncbi:MAG: hypothetical protein ACRD4O_17300 [Bryobacteraceae bacterium]